MKLVHVAIPASVTLTVEVADDATDEQIAEAVEEACPKYPEIKAGQHFDPSEFNILEIEANDEDAEQPDNAYDAGRTDDYGRHGGPLEDD